MTLSNIQTQDIVPPSKPALLERAWPDSQSELVKALCFPATYPHLPTAVTHFETHISHIFLTGDFAYKVKKPLNLGFLDFSSLEKRRHYCAEEVRINRRLAPDLYLGVVPVTGSVTQPNMEGRGTAIEYAVKMRQFTQDGLLDEVLARGELTPVMIDGLARRIADFHSTLSPAPITGDHGTSECIIAAAMQNFEQMRPLIGDPEDHVTLDALHTWTLKEAQALAGVFEARRAHGYVRECHGDLHLGNLTLWKDQVQVFDAIEFNDALRWIDVMNDVAFLVMDLWFRHRKDLAFRFLNQYLEHTGDYEGVRVLRFYLIYRALVRAKVALLRATQDDLPSRRQHKLVVDARSHLNWARTSIEDRRPVVIALHGFSGSGKTTRSEIILETIGAVRVRSDVERKRLYHLASLEHRQSGVGSGIYNESATEATYETLCHKLEPIVQGGFPAIADATFLKLIQREQIKELATKLDVPFVIADFIASYDVLRQRIIERAAYGMDASDADIVVLDAQLLAHEPFTPHEEAVVVPFDTQHQTQRDVRDQARHLLNATRKS